MFDRYFTGHGEDTEADYDPPAFSRKATRTARKTHPCVSCEGTIEVGQRYTLEVRLDSEEGFQVFKWHDDSAECAAMRARVEAWQRERYE
jgi:hypothetical protein